MSRSEDRLEEMFKDILDSHFVLKSLEAKWNRTEEENKRMKELQKDIKYRLDVISRVTGVFYAE